MEKPLRVLIIDDSHKDALLLVRALVDVGYKPEFERVDSIDSLREKVSEHSWDQALCDSKMPT